MTLADAGRVKKRRAPAWLLAGSISLLGAFAFAGMALQWPRGLPARADAIIVLGGGHGDRVVRSLELYRLGYAPRFVLTGGVAPEERESDVPDARAAYLIGHRVPVQDIFHVFPSANSWLEAQATQKLMDDQGWTRVIVVSDPPHMLRLSYTWSKIFRDQPGQFVLVATEPGWWKPTAWWSSRAGFRFVISELVKLGYYAVAY